MTGFPQAYLSGPLQQRYGGMGASGADCLMVTGTTLCTIGAHAAIAAAQGGAGCKDVMWTAGCTFAGAGQGGYQADCGNVLTTLACTLDAPAAVEGQAMCITLLTAYPTFCSPVAASDAKSDCKNVMWTAGCTFAAVPQRAETALDCKHVMWTAGCTF